MDIDIDLINNIKTKVEIAENHVNHLESMVDAGSVPAGLDIPSINELRYALNHLLRYLTGEAAGAVDALKHVHRAIYDCYETESLYQFHDFSAFEVANQDIQMRDVFPKYLDWAREFTELQNFIKDTPRDNRQNYYCELEVLLKKIRPFSSEVRGVRQEILKFRADREKQREEKENTVAIAVKNLALAERTVKIRTIALIITSAVGLLAVLATAYYRP